MPSDYGKRFERELLKSFETIPNSYSNREPGRMLWQRGRIVYIQPKIDLFFASPRLIMKIECKATIKDDFYYSRGMKPGQLQALKDFSRKGPKFLGVLAIYFVKKRKVVFVTRFKGKRVSSSLPGISKYKGVWQVSEFIHERTRHRKSVQKKIPA